MCMSMISPVGATMATRYVRPTTHLVVCVNSITTIVCNHYYYCVSLLLSTITITVWYHYYQCVSLLLLPSLIYYHCMSLLLTYTITVCYHQLCHLTIIITVCHHCYHYALPLIHYYHCVLPCISPLILITVCYTLSRLVLP